ncbi:MAG: baseplate J/gp47 family protein [Candidatus Paceibacterota bacterium]
MHISQSFITLMAFDDANGDGISDPISESVLKQSLKDALGLVSDDSLQSIIDFSYDKLGENFGLYRKTGEKAKGSVIFYTDQYLEADVIVPINTRISTIGTSEMPSRIFQTMQEVTMYALQRNTYWNDANQRYEIKVPIEAVDIGESYTVDVNTIKSLVSSLTTKYAFYCVNDTATYGGTDSENNIEYGTRCMISVAGVDTGSYQGYIKLLAGIPSVEKVSEVNAGHYYMQRDYDDLRRKHIYGSVDLYIKGENLKSASDKFEVEYSVKNTINTIGDLDFTFRLLDSDVSLRYPITNVLGIVNITQSYTYDLTNVSITDYNTILVDKFQGLNIYHQPDPNDVIRVLCDYARIADFILSYQPVREISSVVGEHCGTLLQYTDTQTASSSGGYLLYKMDDPLLSGWSTCSQDFLRIFRSNINGLPADNYYDVTDNVVMKGTEKGYLTRNGVDLTSVIVESDDGVLYGDNIDYILYDGTDYKTSANKKSSPPYLVRVPSGRIANGESVVVTYKALENITVTYTYNSLLYTVQNQTDTFKHVDADILVKQMNPSPIDIEAYAKFIGNISPETVKYKITNSIDSDLDDKKAGDAVHQSDIIADFEKTDGVDYVDVPFTVFKFSDDTYIVKELVNQSFIPVVSGAYIVYATPPSAFTFGCYETGAPENYFSGVYQNSESLYRALSITEVSNTQGAFYISSDNALYVSLAYGSSPSAYSYYVTYMVHSNDISILDLTIPHLSYPMIGDINIFEK